MKKIPHQKTLRNCPEHLIKRDKDGVIISYAKIVFDPVKGFVYYRDPREQDTQEDA